MERCELLFFLFAFVLLSRHVVLSNVEIPLSTSAKGEDDQPGRLQIYIVHVEKPTKLVFGSRIERDDWHKSFLPSHTLDSGEPRLVYSYEHAIAGFAARLTPEEVKAMEAMDGFLYAEPDEEVITRTTHTPKFLGLTRSAQLWEKANRGQGTVIGVVESGFYSKHESFMDDGMPNPLPRWNGTCTYEPHRCNKKLIGNRIFNASGIYDTSKEYSHGTHVASIAAGNISPGANFVGEACGSASGTAPRAHLAFYSIVGISDALMAIDQAVNDGIDVLSLSIGMGTALPFHRNSFDIATLSAVEKNVFVSVAAGNDGPAPGSMLDNTPWTLSVGASTIDRVVRVDIRLGNGRIIKGETADPESMFFPVGTVLPAVFPGNLTGIYNVSHCNQADFGGVNVSGKVVLCLQGHLRTTRIHPLTKSCIVDGAGGKALVLLNEKLPGSTMFYYNSCGEAPTVNVNYEEAKRLRAYFALDPNPSLSFEPRRTITEVRRNPSVADFSARGPSPVNNGVLKPDILGPGVNVLGAYPWDYRAYFYESGTSMACPHLSGIAALLRSVHPRWSPAMIKSAIMTTADWLDNAGMPIADETGNTASLFAAGAGQVNANRAADPGLVYDIRFRDYVRYVCGLGYSRKQTNAVLRRSVDCAAVGAISGEELNYPSFSINASSTPKIITRTVTNVGGARATYTLTLDQPADVWIDVFPRKLEFKAVRQRLSYTVNVVSTNPQRLPGEVTEGQLSWVSGHHTVRSPISVTFTGN